MPRAWPDVVEVVVLAADAHALLAGDGALIGALFHAQEDVFELDHAGVDEQQSRVVVGDKIAAVDDGVTMLVEVVEVILANLIGR